MFGGNNRARTCDLLLVRQMLSQLSYAPVTAFSGLTSATWIIIHRKVLFVKHFFRFFCKNFVTRNSPISGGIPGKNHTFFSNSRISSGVKVYTVSQNWHSTGKDLPSAMISVSSSLPMLISAASTRWRLQ